MKATRSVRALSALLALLLAVAVLPGASPARAAGPDLRLEYLGWWDPSIPAQSTLIKFRVTNVGDAPSDPTTGSGQTLHPPVPQETAPSIPALEPGASFDFPYPLQHGLSCLDHRVRIAAPLAGDANPADNTLEVDVCRTDAGADLTVEYLGLDPANNQSARYRVTNVGVEPTEPTVLRVEGQAPSVPATELEVPALAPGQDHEVGYQLAGTAGCDRHELTTSVSLAGDRYLPDNVHSGRACPELVVAGPIPDQIGPAPRRIPPPKLETSEAARCTGLFRLYATGGRWDLIYAQPALEECTRTMGLEKYCADRKSYVATSYEKRVTGDPRGNRRALVCQPYAQDDSFGEELERLVTGIAEGLADAAVAAAPFMSMAIQGAGCLKGLIFACATLALDIAGEAGAEVPGLARDAVDVAKHAPDCISGDVIACVRLGARGAKAGGLEIPGVDAGDVAANVKKCAAEELPACLRVGQAAADAAGVRGGPALGSAADAQACADGDTNACANLGRAIGRATDLPLNDIIGGAENAQKCAREDVGACVRLGKEVAEVAGL